jgi:hypothetical protein
MSFPDKPYVSLEQLSFRDFALSDPVGFLDTHASVKMVSGFKCCKMCKVDGMMISICLIIFLKKKMMLSQIVISAGF